MVKRESLRDLKNIIEALTEKVAAKYVNTRERQQIEEFQGRPLPEPFDTVAEQTANQIQALQMSSLLCAAILLDVREALTGADASDAEEALRALLKSADEKGPVN